MAYTPRHQNDEIYRCSRCEKQFAFQEVQNNWKCPDCGRCIGIKLLVNNHQHECHRVPPCELRQEELITFENEHIHEILAINKYGDNYRIALKGFGVITASYDSIITRINGGWYD